MSAAARFIVRICFASVLILVAGTMAVFGFQILEPMYAGFGEPNAALGWGEPGLQALEFASIGMLGSMLVIVIWFVFSPVKNDRRQQYRY